MAAPSARGGRKIHPLAWFWIYTGLRLALLLAIFGLLWLFGLGGFVGAAVALLLTIPLSYVVLARPRAAMVASMDLLREQRRVRTNALDEQLSTDSADSAAVGQVSSDAADSPAVEQIPPNADGADAVQPGRPHRKNRS